MSYYREKQADGSIKKVPKKKGPTRQGWVKNPENPEEYIPAEGVSGHRETSYQYIRFDNETGQYANSKPVGRGRRPLGYIKFFKIDNELKLAPDETLPANALPSTIPAEVGIMAEAHSAVKPFPDTDLKVEFDELHKCLKAGRIEKSGSLHVYKLVDVVGDPKIEFLRQNRAVSRVEVDTDSGDVSVWNIEYNPNQPDALIEGVVK